MTNEQRAWASHVQQWMRNPKVIPDPGPFPGGPERWFRLAAQTRGATVREVERIGPRRFRVRQTGGDLERRTAVADAPPVTGGGAVPAVPVSPRTVDGVCVPYGVPALIGGDVVTYTETMLAGVFTTSIARRSRVPLLAEHDRHRLPVGVAIRLTETRDGLRGRFGFTPGSPWARQVWPHVVDGSLGALSVGFRAEVTDWTVDDNGVPVSCERVRADLQEVSLVPVPAYRDAVVTGWAHDAASDTPAWDAVAAWAATHRIPAWKVPA